MSEIPEQLMLKIEQMRKLDKNRNKSGTPMDVYADLSGVMADYAIEIVDELLQLVKSY